ncbi:hypothetical protein TNCV_4616071 [Trichonephila clavipes]|nr:hypothetical protein TNCV_4616071 [Trichonephila clavipes]
MLKYAHSSDTLSQRQAYELHRRFRKRLDAAESSGRLQTSHTAEDIEKVSDVTRYVTSSYDNPTPLSHADTSRDVFPRGGTSQSHMVSDWMNVEAMRYKLYREALCVHSLGWVQ